MPALSLSRRQALVVAAALALVLVVAGKLLVGTGSAHRAQAMPFRAAAPPAPPRRLVIDVAGAVRRPGLYRLPQGSRIADAVARAGGTTAKAALDAVNLAAPLADGEQVVVPLRVPGGGVAAAATGGAGGPASGPVSLSTATARFTFAPFSRLGTTAVRPTVAITESNTSSACNRVRR